MVATDIRVSQGTGAVRPQVAVRGSTVLVAFHDLNAGFLCARSIDGGANFAAPVRINDLLGRPYYWGSQTVAFAPTGEAYAVFEDHRSGSHIYVNRSDDGGQTWRGDVQADSVSQNGLNCSLAVTGTGRVVVSYTGYDGSQYDAYVAVSDDKGLSFQPAARINLTSEQDDATDIAAQGSRVVVAYNSFQGDVFVAESTNNGLSFGVPVRVNDVLGMARGVSVAVDAQEIFVAWSDTRTDQEGEIFFDRTFAPGPIFGSDVLVNDVSTRYQEDPELVMDPVSRKLIVVWQDFRSNSAADRYDIYGSVSTDGGLTFQPNFVVNRDAFGYQMNPGLAVDSQGRVLCAWRDDRNQSSFDIFFTAR